MNNLLWFKSVKPIACAVVALILAGAAGCTVQMHMYPVAGQAAEQTPPPVFPARMSANFNSKSGKISTTLADGETFQGVWILSTPGPASPASPADLSGTWDLVYGPGFFTAHVLGNRYCGIAQLTGSKGTPLNVQVCGTPETKAVAKDGKGNVYKLTVG